MHKKKAMAKQEYDPIANRLKEVRISLNMTQREMGEAVKFSSAGIGALENGLYTPNFHIIRALKKKFNISYDFLFDGKGISSTTKELEDLKDKYNRVVEENERLKRVVDKLTNNK